MSGMGETCSIEIQQLRELKGPLVDVRSPGEFEKGHWPGAINVPLFNDEERAAVGTAYKQQGRTPAIHLGLELTGPKLSSLARQLESLRDQGDPRIYCWRGGMRSASVAWLAQQIDLKPRLLQGGYKSYRRWAQSRFEQAWPLRVMGGRTGTGKTDLLLAMAARGAAVVDLEGLANHRGSSFGGLGLPDQPSTEHYENQLAEALDQHQRRGATAIWWKRKASRWAAAAFPRPFSIRCKRPLCWRFSATSGNG